MRRKYFLFTLTLLLIVFVLGYCLACLNINHTQSGQLLNIAVTPTDNNTYFSPEDLCSNFDGDMNYYGVKDVIIKLRNKEYRLEDAIANEMITIEEIISFARIDARNGFCKEDAHSENGLTQIIYHYWGKFDLSIIYDIYETPDRKQHLINRISFGESLQLKFSSPTIYIEDENGDSYPIDQEDWGIRFYVSEASPSRIMLNAVQTGGQHMGKLNIIDISLLYLDKDGNLSGSDWKHGVFSLETNTTIDNKAESIIELTCLKEPESLQSGRYKMWVLVEDVYDEADIHPLTRNYKDVQFYYVYFKVP